MVAGGSVVAAIRVSVGDGAAVFASVNVGSGVEVAEGVKDGSGVDVAEGVNVEDGACVSVGDGVTVQVEVGSGSVGEGVTVHVGVGPVGETGGVCDGVGVSVGLGVRDGVGVRLAVGVRPGGGLSDGVSVTGGVPVPAVTETVSEAVSVWPGNTVAAGSVSLGVMVRVSVPVTDGRAVLVSSGGWLAVVDGLAVAAGRNGLYGTSVTGVIGTCGGPPAITGEVGVATAGT